MPEDLGDAPFPLPTLRSQDGARHEFVGTAARFGNTVDTETEGQPTADADGDDDDTTDDEDGIVFPATIRSGQLAAEVTVDVQNAAGRLDAWVDFNSDGSFDSANEQIFTAHSLNVGNHTLTFSVPADAPITDTTARFRISAKGNLAPRGKTNDGEVEDHKLSLSSPPGYGVLIRSDNRLGSHYSHGVSLGDLDDDGDLDAFVANEGSGSRANRVWLNDGIGSFRDSGIGVGSHRSYGVSLGDLDRDGDLDAFVANGSDQANRVWLNDGSGPFRDSGNSLGDGDSRSVSLGDLDGDGHLDAFVANTGNTANRIWLNDGSGSFQDSEVELGDHSSRSVSLGDVDGDGDLDAFVANQFQGNRVWLNDGTGSFRDAGTGLGNYYGRGVSLGDLDEDGDLDAFVANFDGNRVWLNDSSGSFRNSDNSLGNRNSFGVSLGDMDGDGDLDAFVANLLEANRVWLNDGSGSFNDIGNSLGNHISRAVSLGDVDGDGDLDSFVANAGAGVNRVWLNVPLDLGDAPTPLPTLLDQSGAAHIIGGPRLGDKVDNELDGQPNADADGDDNAGDADEDGVIFASAVLTGALAAEVTVDVQNTGGQLDGWVDFNADGSFDLAGERIFTGLSLAAGSHSLAFSVPADAFQGITFGRFRLSAHGVPGPRGMAFSGEVEDHKLELDAAPGTGYFMISANSLGDSSSRGVAVGDLDGDGDIDAVVANNGYSNRVWLNDSSGSFRDSSNSLGNHNSSGASLGDVDGDGDLDALIANFFAQPNRVWLNDGSGSFRDSGSGMGNLSSRGAALGDLDGDGDLDVFVVNDQGQPARVWLNDGSGGFADSGNSLVSTDGQGVALGDLDGDGDLDAFVTNGSYQSNRIWVNDGSGSFRDSGNSLGNFYSRDIALGDLDGDGDLDGWVSNGIYQPDRVWLNDGSGSFARNNSLGDRSGNGVSLGDVDGDGDLDAWVANANIYFSPDRLWLNDGSGSFATNGQSLGNVYGADVSLGDLDNDGDLDAFVVNSSPNRVWLNAPSDADSDGVADPVDNCPDDANPGQENLDGDEFGNVCDDDVDGDGLDNGEGGGPDTDDDNDGLSNADEATATTDPFDPDTDDDGVIDSLDRSPTDEFIDPNICFGQGTDAIYNISWACTITCAAANTVETIPPAAVETFDLGTCIEDIGDYKGLLLISPTVEFGPGFVVEPGGILTIISTDPTAEIPPPPP